jgi:hypothetical protein
VTPAIICISQHAPLTQNNSRTTTTSSSFSALVHHNSPSATTHPPAPAAPSLRLETPRSSHRAAAQVLSAPPPPHPMFTTSPLPSSATHDPSSQRHLIDRNSLLSLQRRTCVSALHHQATHLCQCQRRTNSFSRYDLTNNYPSRRAAPPSSFPVPAPHQLIRHSLVV